LLLLAVFVLTWGGHQQRAGQDAVAIRDWSGRSGIPMHSDERATGLGR
jgi:hypothetical protein